MTESVKAALLISGADKMRFGKLKDELANNYLLGTDQYPDTFEKAMRILKNYQLTKASRPYQGDGTESGLTFIQQGGRGRGHGGWGGGAGRGAPTSKGADAGTVDASSATTGLGVTKRVREGQDESIEQETRTATTAAKWIIGGTNAQI